MGGVGVVISAIGTCVDLVSLVRTIAAPEAATLFSLLGR
jgi:hypothetical protein